jgi:predicted polyphosphate/ATP-dependent NAD kinase
MTDGEPGRARAVLGLLVNPIAGIGGRVGLKGSDGADTVRRALALGASPEAGARATTAIRELLARWPAPGVPPVVLAGPLEMGEAAAVAAGARPSVIGSIVPGATTAADTVRLAGLMVERGVDLLLFAGGDGTARDIHAALRDAPVPVLGIPAGVKIHSAVFATGPAAAGAVAAGFLALPSGRRRTKGREVLDLDEEAYRRGEIAPRLWGELPVPLERRRIQARKAPTPASEAAAVAAIADEVAAASPIGIRLILGPGSTVRAIADRLGVAKTLVGVDVVRIVGPGVATLVATDVGETELLLVAAAGGCRIVVTPIGGQGFIFGRGNQQISPPVIRDVLRRAGKPGIIIVATPVKLAAIGTRPLLVDTGDPALDRELAGYAQVITGRGERSVARVAAA